MAERHDLEVDLNPEMRTSFQQVLGTRNGHNIVPRNIFSNVQWPPAFDNSGYMPREDHMDPEVRTSFLRVFEELHSTFQRFQRVLNSRNGQDIVSRNIVPTHAELPFGLYPNWTPREGGQKRQRTSGTMHGRQGYAISNAVCHRDNSTDSGFCTDMRLTLPFENFATSVITHANGHFGILFHDGQTSATDLGRAQVVLAEKAFTPQSTLLGLPAELHLMVLERAMVQPKHITIAVVPRYAGGPSTSKRLISDVQDGGLNFLKMAPVAMRAAAAEATFKHNIFEFCTTQASTEFFKQVPNASAAVRRISLPSIHAGSYQGQQHVLDLIDHLPMLHTIWFRFDHVTKVVTDPTISPLYSANRAMEISALITRVKWRTRRTNRCPVSFKIKPDLRKLCEPCRNEVNLLARTIDDYGLKCDRDPTISDLTYFRDCAALEKAIAELSLID